jgi:creatinine amidohydrolase
MPMRPWKLAEINYGVVKEQDYEVALLPLGATEPHNLHLPYGTDVFEAEIIGDKICEAAWNRGAKVVLLPTIPYGTETNLMRFPLTMNLNPATLAVVLGDLVDSLARHGIHKIVLLNGHGGNDLKPVLRELYEQTPARLFLCNWFTVCKDVYDKIFAAADDHAGEIETSLMLAYHPELVARNADGGLSADEGRAAASRFEAVNRGWVSISRPWHLLTTNSGCGNPHAATADKGCRLLEVLVERLAGFLVELSGSPLDERFPY